MNENKFNIIDIHNHSLPNIDDGAIDIDMSTEMIRIASNSGTSDIVLTPHHLNGAFTNFADDVIENTRILQEKVDELNIPINLHFGSEVHLVPETVEHLIENKTLTYCGIGKAALIELPKSTIPAGTESILSELLYNEITPIIAHPERNSRIRKDYSQFKDWIEFGCKSQVTGQSCTGSFGESLQMFSFELISNNLVHFVASDAHRPEGRNPNLQKALNIISKTFGDDITKILFHDNPSQLIKGQEITNLRINTADFKHRPSKSKKSKKGLFNFFN